MSSYEDTNSIHKNDDLPGRLLLLVVSSPYVSLVNCTFVQDAAYLSIITYRLWSRRDGEEHRGSWFFQGPSALKGMQVNLVDRV
jgi:hypothetical protein